MNKDEKENVEVKEKGEGGGMREEELIEEREEIEGIR